MEGILMEGICGSSATLWVLLCDVNRPHDDDGGAECIAATAGAVSNEVQAGAVRVEVKGGVVRLENIGGAGPGASQTTGLDSPKASVGISSDGISDSSARVWVLFSDPNMVSPTVVCLFN